MTQYSKDFSDEGTTGIFASDFTSRWSSMSGWTIEAEADAEDNRVFESDGSDNNGYQLASWNDIDGDANRDNIELVVRFRVDTDDDNMWYAIARASGSDNDETGYVIYVNSSGFLTIGKLIDGSISTLALIEPDRFDEPWYMFTGGRQDPLFSYTPADRWVWVRFRINGTGATVTLQGKVWGDGQPEPVEWTLEDLDTSGDRITGVGFNGIGVFSTGDNDVTQFDYLGVGTNGDAAPIILNPATVNRLSSSYVQVAVSEGDPRVRLSSVYAQVAVSSGDPRVRLSSVYAQAAVSEGNPRVRLTGSFIQMVYKEGVLDNVHPVSVITN